MYPSLTPFTMFAIKLRVNPHRDLPVRSSCEVEARIFPSFISTLIGDGTVQSKRPFGPSMETACPFISTFVFGGISTGCFPIRDITHQTYAKISPPTLAFLAS